MPTDLELLEIEVHTIWRPTGEPGRIRGPELVIASAGAGLVAGVGEAVPDDLATTLRETVASAKPSAAQEVPPAVLDVCARLLHDRLGPLEVGQGSGPSYLIPETVSFQGSSTLLRSNDRDAGALHDANPGNWPDEEWQKLIDGRLGPWVMAVEDGIVVSICHTPASSDRAAEAGTWTRPEFRGQGYAATVTAAWASVLRPTGKFLFYSTSRANYSSQRVAARLRLRPLGWLWQLKLSK